MSVMNYDLTLIDKVVCQMQVDIEEGEFDEIKELLSHVPEKVLQDYLPRGA
jgi:hypothetical protein